MQPTIAQMKQALAKGGQPDASNPKRIKIDAKGPGGVRGIVVPRHMLHGTQHAEGMDKINEARAAVYGSENRPPMTLGQMGSTHKKTLEEHFAKPLDEQVSAEQDALNRLRTAKHIGKTANTLDKSEKLDTVRHEHDAQGRTYEGFASKGIAGHALYTSGHGDKTERHVLNTCAGQTTGCGGGTDKNGVVDTSKGTCFAPNAESQYVNAAVRRACHAQAKHDPAMTKDWIIAHTGSMREAADKADKRNTRLLFRPNVVDETDVSSRHVIRGLNKQRAAENKPPITANSYGKTNELHDPENGYYVTYSNVGPKTKQGSSIAENIARDKQRVRSTILAVNGKGEDTVNDDGHKTPPKGSYMVTDVKRDSPMAKKMEKTITHAKYWSTGRPVDELTEQEKAEGPMGHFGPNGKPTTPEKAHYGHTTLNDKRYDYQKQHILHPRLVQVGQNEDGTPHMIPTDSRFKDEDFLPKDRFKSKNGKTVGHLLMTTPTTSTSTVQHQSAFTHHVNEGHIKHAQNNNGEYEIDPPHAQEASAGKEYAPPQPIKFMAEGGAVHGSGKGVLHAAHRASQFDEYMGHPEQSFAAQFQLAHRHDPEEKLEFEYPKRAAKRTHTMSKGGSAAPTMDEMRAHLVLHKADGGAIDIKEIGAEEAPNMAVKEFMSPGIDKISLPVGGVDFQPQMPGKQMMPGQPPQQPGGLPGAPQGATPPGAPPMGATPPGAPPMGAMPPGMPGAPPAPPKGPQSNILAMTPQGQAMQAMRPNPMAMPRPPALPMKGMAKGGSTTPSVQEMRKAIAGAATSAGMKAPVVANRELTTMQDTYDSLGDRINKGAADMQDMIESTPYKYEPGQHVFTPHSAKHNLPPFKIIRRILVGNNPMRENHPKLGPGMGKFIKDPATGKTMRTPYEPGYHVTRTRNDGDHAGVEEMHLPESAFLGHLKAGGSTHDIHLEERKL